MTAKAGTAPTFKNRLLTRLPAAALRRLRKSLKEVTLARRDVLHEPEQPYRYVYFPETAMFSLATVAKDGTETEIASIGREGMLGLPALLGAKKSGRRAFCQLPGTAYRISVAVLRRETRHGGPFSAIIQKYALFLFTELAQLATCNRRHTVEQRFCCRLLLTHDQVEGDDFEVTHEFLSHMLSARRSGVTVIAGALQRAGLISYTRGQITILNRKGLEKAACECYGIARREFDRLLG
jgi:CRP-like cAMP-binding protein